MLAIVLDTKKNQETVLANLELLFFSSLFQALIEFVWKAGWIRLPSTYQDTGPPETLINP